MEVRRGWLGRGRGQEKGSRKERYKRQNGQRKKKDIKEAWEPGKGERGVGQEIFVQQEKKEDWGGVDKGNVLKWAWKGEELDPKPSLLICHWGMQRSCPRLRH